MIGSFGWMELLLILFIVLIIFGAGKIPQLGEGLGKAIKGFKKSMHEADAVDITPSSEDDSQPTASPPPDQIAEPAIVQPVPQSASPVQQSVQQSTPVPQAKETPPA